MKKLLSFIAIFAIISCAKQTISNLPKENKLQNISNLPSWVLDPSVKDGVAAVGIASPSKGGIKFQIPKAELDAKANIASTIGSKVSRITKNALRSANVNNEDDVEEFFSQATKDVINDLPLSGVKRANMFQASDGTLYIQMVLKEEDYSKFLKNSEKTFEEKLKRSNLGRDNISKSQEATKALFDELDNERNFIYAK